MLLVPLLQWDDFARTRNIASDCNGGLWATTTIKYSFILAPFEAMDQTTKDKGRISRLIQISVHPPTPSRLVL